MSYCLFLLNFLYHYQLPFLLVEMCVYSFTPVCFNVQERHYFAISSSHRTHSKTLILGSNIVCQEQTQSTLCLLIFLCHMSVDLSMSYHQKIRKLCLWDRVCNVVLLGYDLSISYIRFFFPFALVTLWWCTGQFRSIMFLWDLTSVSVFLVVAHGSFWLVKINVYETPRRFTSYMYKKEEASTLRSAEDLREKQMGNWVWEYLILNHG